MGRKVSKNSRKKKRNNNKINQVPKSSEEEFDHGPQTYEKYFFLATFIGAIVFLFVYLGGFILYLVK